MGQGKQLARLMEGRLAVCLCGQASEVGEEPHKRRGVPPGFSPSIPSSQVPVRQPSESQSVEPLPPVGSGCCLCAGAVQDSPFVSGVNPHPVGFQSQVSWGLFPSRVPNPSQGALQRPSCPSCFVTSTLWWQDLFGWCLSRLHVATWLVSIFREGNLRGVLRVYSFAVKLMCAWEVSSAFTHLPASLG